MAKDVAAKTSPGGASIRVSMSGTSRMGVVAVGHHSGPLAGPITLPSGFLHELLEHDVGARRGASL